MRWERILWSLGWPENKVNRDIALELPIWLLTIVKCLSKTQDILNGNKLVTNNWDIYPLINGSVKGVAAIWRLLMVIHQSTYQIRTILGDSINCLSWTTSTALAIRAQQPLLIKAACLKTHTNFYCNCIYFNGLDICHCVTEKNGLSQFKKNNADTELSTYLMADTIVLLLWTYPWWILAAERSAIF